MTYYDEQLRLLAEQCARANHLTAMLRDLEKQHISLGHTVRRLEEIKLDEQADVDRLEGGSLASFFYNVVGKLDEKLTEERRQAYAARVKYDAALRELEGVQADLRRYRAELDALAGCEEKFRAVLAQKAEKIRTAGGPDAGRLLELEGRSADLTHHIRELNEAISAGSAALDTVDGILASLSSAEGWGTWDLFSGGLLSDLAKHSHLDEAQSAVEQLQSQLRRFRTELADVSVQADLQVNIDGFLRFADYFFDGLFADWTVLDQIHQSQEQVQATRRQISAVLSRLDRMRRQAKQEQEQLRQQTDSLVQQATL